MHTNDFTVAIIDEVNSMTTGEPSTAFYKKKTMTKSINKVNQLLLYKNSLE